MLLVAAPGRAVRSEVIMKIDIDGLTEVELIDLNNRIVEALRSVNADWAWITIYD